MSQYPNVFSPVTVGTVELPNRVYLPPHGIPLVAPGPDDTTVPSVEYAKYFQERAAAGVGLIVHSTSIDQRGAEGVASLNSGADERAIPSFRAVAESVHAVGGKIFAEIWYYPNFLAWERGAPARPFFGASPVQPADMVHVSRALNKREIGYFVERFVRTARNLRTAGYDGIELHVSHGTLLELFLSPYFNRRTDAYGGDLDGRMRLLVETLEQVRDVLGDAPLGLRYNANERTPGGLDLEQSTEILGRLKRDGLLDFIDIDFSHEPQQQELMWTNYFVEPLKHQSDDLRELRATGALDGLIVMAAGRRVTNLAQMEQMLAGGLVDLVGSVRGLMAEPEMVKNALEGREDRSRACLACNNQFGTTGFTCVINPAVGREARWGSDSFTAAPEHKKVVVVGGGPAGLEAARVAARRGHEVVLLEQRPYLGGLMKAKANLPGRDVYQQQIDWWEHEAHELGVDVRLDVEATAAAVLDEGPDAVILATGSTYDPTGSNGWIIGAIPGADKAHVYTADDVLLHGARPTGTVLIFDGENISTGPGIVEVLGGAGAKCVLVTPSMPGVALREAIDAIPQMFTHDVEVLPQTFLSDIGDGAVMLAPVLRDSASMLAGRPIGEAAIRMGIDAVTLASQRQPSNTTLESELDGKVEALYVIGDGLAPRDLRSATYEGQLFARFVGEPDAPKTTSDALFAPAPLGDVGNLAPAATLLAGEAAH